MVFLFAASCDDGDIVEVNFEFEGDLERCAETSVNYLLYDINQNNTESFTLLFPVSGNRIIFEPEINGQLIEREINNSTRFNYRVYNGNPEGLICSLLGDPGTTIVDDYEAAPGALAIFISTFEDDDGDGIPSDMEGRGGQADDGSYPDAEDFDGDDLPNYRDPDDDNDNVLTEDEIDFDENDILIEQDTDDDGIPDWKDDDDDGDGILTIDEDEDGDTNLFDDFDPNSENINIPRFRDSLAMVSFERDSLRTVQFSRNVNVGVVIENVSIEILQTTEIDMGVYRQPPLIYLYNQNTGELELRDN